MSSNGSRIDIYLLRVAAILFAGLFLASPLTAYGQTFVSAADAAASNPQAVSSEGLSQPGDVPQTETLPATPNSLTDVEGMLSPQGLSSTLKVMGLLTVLSLAPSILIMTTCFIRFVIVLGLLRQALGTQQLPPNQVIISLCLFLTILVMAPVWKQAYNEGIQPYTDPVAGQRQPTLEEAFTATVRPIRRFMSDQIEMTGNSDTVWMFLEFQQGTESAGVTPPETYDDVPLNVLLPAYMLSELKTAFIIGFQVYLPFLIIDMVVGSVLISMGMMMLPPVLISLPFKLLLFVMIDGWFLTVGMLLESVRPFG
ncbi:flagellar type III secretion system pore protein FliP [Calycomorphotria hydatis]|uniref:Flagellar biosynthetic protein FliP n=1 Tax=Calycomorphotria hydatis TaxID=2528027 RepID=A0A517TB95_9PLAN|nr:flagellar type III secretion system pore protein FliP [Calycomorphotria hydatis]QDT65636.1 Flagellar biosynthetic protein FliP precursor [Calycomorphotria hydatis]